MRIGIDIRALMEGKSTGVEVYISNLLQALFRQDKKNEYVLFANAFRPVRLPDFSSPNVEMRMFHYPGKLFNLSQKYLRHPQTGRLLGKIDLFFSPHYRTLALPESVPLVVTFHDLSFEAFPEFFTPRQRLWHSFQDYRGAAARAARIIAVSEHTRADLCEVYGVDSKKIEVIYPGVPPLSSSQADMRLPEKYFLAFGTHEPRKNLAGVIAAYAEYRDSAVSPLPLVIAGHRGWKSEFRIPQRLRDFVLILSDVDEQQKSRLYHGAFALLFLSFYEGFGFPILEAASCGVPVVASHATSLSEIGQDFALLVNPFRPSQAAAAMRELCADEKLRVSLREAGYLAAQKYSWDKSAVLVLNLFQKLTH